MTHKLDLKVNVTLLDNKWLYFYTFFPQRAIYKVQAPRRPVGGEGSGFQPEALTCLRKIPDEWFQKTQAADVGRGLKGTISPLLYKYCWRAKGILCACVFPFSIGEIKSNTGTSCDKICEVEAEGTARCSRRNVPQVCGMLYYDWKFGMLLVY